MSEHHHALPPETLEGWYALHQTFRIDRASWRALVPDERNGIVADASRALDELTRASDRGWSACVALVGSRDDLMLVHFRATLDDIGDVQRAVSSLALADFLEPGTTFLSVTEAGMYHLTAKLSKEAAARGGAVGDDAYRQALETALDAERASDHVKRRLYPPLPADMPWVCFYPMDKRRDAGQNWYTLTLDERSQLMYAHGMTGRRYAGKVQQVITGAIGFDAWEWGVTLFARDPLSFKKLVTDMRFDEVSAKYAAFGEFFVGRVASPAEWVAALAPR